MSIAVQYKTYPEKHKALNVDNNSRPKKIRNIHAIMLSRNKSKVIFFRNIKKDKNIKTNEIT